MLFLFLFYVCVLICWVCKDEIVKYLYKEQTEAKGIPPNFLCGGDLNKVNKFLAAVEHGNARSCTHYYASYCASFFFLLAPVVLGSANWGKLLYIY